MKKVSSISVAGYSGFTLVLVYLFYYLKKVDISLIYNWQQTIPLSFAESLKFPGGISTLLADLILEFTTQAIYGKVMFALLLVVVFFSLKTIFRRDRDNPLFFALLFASLIPFILLFSHYRLPFELVTSITTALFLGMSYSYYRPRNLGLRTLSNFFAGIVVFIVSGVPGLVVLLQLFLIQALYSKRYLDLISVLPVLILPLLYLPFNIAVTIKQAFYGLFLISGYDEIPPIFYYSLFSPLLLFWDFHF